MDIVAVRNQGNPGLRLLGAVMCKVDMRTRMAAVYTDKIRREWQAGTPSRPWKKWVPGG